VSVAAPPLWATQLIVAMALNAITQAIQIGAYAARYAGVKTERIATSISLFNLFVTASRLAALFLTPSLGALADNATRPVVAAKLSGVPPEVVGTFDTQMRLIVAAGTLGTVVGAALLPTFIYLFTRGIRSFERRNSVFRAVIRLGDPRVMMDVLASVRLPELPTILAQSRETVPAKLLIGNLIVMAIYAIGVPAAYYASVLNLDARTTAAGLSGIVNGIGTLAFVFFVDPTSALMVDQAVKAERSINSIRAMVIGLTVTAILGTILSQLLLWPGAWVIAHVASFFVHGFGGHH
jgi:Amj-like protein